MFPTHAPAELLAEVKVAVIGPTTQATVMKHGVQVDVIARTSTIDSLAEAIGAVHLSLLS